MQYQLALADELADDRIVHAAMANRVILGDQLGGMLEMAAADGLRPVLVTQGDAALSPFVWHAMGLARVHWAVRVADGPVFDARSGCQLTSFGDMWEPPSHRRRRHPRFRAPLLDSEAVLWVDIALRRRLRGVRAAALAARLLHELAAARPEVWDTREPLLRPWHPGEADETARRSGPALLPVLVRGSRATYATLGSGVTALGRVDRVGVGIPLGAWRGPRPDIAARTREVLTRVAAETRPLYALAALSETGTAGVRTPTRRRPDVPMAAVVGDDVRTALGADAGLLAAGPHTAVDAGKGTTVVTFDGGTGALWTRLGALASTAGLDATTEGRPPHGN
jgi:hypothetical protein